MNYEYEVPLHYVSSENWLIWNEVNGNTNLSLFLFKQPEISVSIIQHQQNSFNSLIIIQLVMHAWMDLKLPNSFFFITSFASSSNLNLNSQKQPFMIYPTITLQNVSAIFDLLHIDKPWNLHASNSTHVHTNLYQSRNLYGQMHVYLGLSSEPFDCNRKQPNNLEPNATPPMKRYERDDVTSIKASSRFDEWSIPGGWRHDA